MLVCFKSRKALYLHFTVILLLTGIKRSGWRQDAAEYNRQDMVSLLKFYDRTSQAARDQGYEYVIEKWEAIRKK